MNEDTQQQMKKAQKKIEAIDLNKHDKTSRKQQQHFKMRLHQNLKQITTLVSLTTLR
jgi:hypothetical protein